MTGEPVGLAVLDKPGGMTSHDVVAAVRRALQIRRVGHAGTLDPPATGVLLVGVGRATRLLRFLATTEKSYDGTFALGATTTTLDAAGEVTATFEMRGVTPEAVAAAAATLTGDVTQLPPMVSAVQVGGRRLHELAREGVEVERPARQVVVQRFDVAPVDPADDPAGTGGWRFSVTCSSGTYVRALVDDLGRALGGGAHVTSLRRTRSGTFTLADAMALEVALAEPGALLAALRPPLAMVTHLGVVEVSADDAAHLVRGRRVTTSAAGNPGEVAVRDGSGALVCVAVRDAAGVLRPDVVVAAQGDAGCGR